MDRLFLGENRTDRGVTVEKGDDISKSLFRNFRPEINFITINDTTPASTFLAPSALRRPRRARGSATRRLRIDRIESGRFRNAPRRGCVRDTVAVCACTCTLTQPRR